PVGQSTVSHHLAALAAVGFVQVRRRGTSSLYGVNPRCLDCFPSAADVVMGRRPPDPPPPACTPSTLDPGS
ncbi:MAG: ArsR/SmtB family transcription factor, partial [Geodermatophilaceae bacterium]